MTKTPRGSYFVICVGPSYYAGTRPIMQTVTVREHRDWTEAEKKKPRYKRSLQRGFGPHRVPTKGKGKHDTWRYGYYEKQTAPTEKVERQVPSNQYIEDWTTEFSKAKKFRIHSKALAKAAELAKSNSMEKIQPKVILHEGDR